MLLLHREDLQEIQENTGCLTSICYELLKAIRLPYEAYCFCIILKVLHIYLKIYIYIVYYALYDMLQCQEFCTFCVENGLWLCHIE